MDARRVPYGTDADGREVGRFVLENSRGMRVSAIGYGATITEVLVPGRGGSANVALGYATLEAYRAGSAFLGCIVGRFANRIRDGRFFLDGRECTLARNDGVNHIHGGTRGFDKALWAGKLFRKANAAGVRWSYTSRDGEEGYPGTLKVIAEYALSEDCELSLEYWASSDRPTPVNLTNHSYWNLAGAGSGTVLAQEIAFHCPWYLPVNEQLLPTGEILKTAGTPFDFAAFKRIGRDLAAVPGGYDHCMVIGKPPGAFDLVCTVRDNASGRAMEVRTTTPGVQFYTGNFLVGAPFPRHAGFCLETQHFPDSPNFGHFPSCIVRPGEPYHHLTVHAFSF
jgi:aldose 1-epimerase